jgi:aminoglycoside 6'-N-acetyltransferase
VLGGIALRSESRGRGIGARAQGLLRGYLLDHTRADRIQAVTDVENRAEQRALETAGFRREGVIGGSVACRSMA